MSQQQRREFNRRRAFVRAVETEICSLTSLCKTFDISRQTGYRWLQDYRLHGLQGLILRDPDRRRSRISADVESTVLHLRRVHGWGALRILRHLEGTSLKSPSLRTINNILHRAGGRIPAGTPELVVSL